MDRVVNGVSLPLALALSPATNAGGALTVGSAALLRRRGLRARRRLRVDVGGAAVLAQLAAEQRGRERRRNVVRNGALHVARARCRRPSRRARDRSSRSSERSSVTLRAPSALRERVDVNRDDRFDLREAELLERHDLVDAIEQLGAQRERELVVFEVGRQNDQRVAEVDRAAFGVGNAAVVENLQQNGGDVGVRFFEFVEEHDAVRAAADRFGELAGFVVARISRRCAEQPRDRVRLR